MKVLLVTEDLPVAQLGGAGKHAVLLGNVLLANGHDVHLLGRRRAPGLEGNNDFKGTLHCTIDLRGTGWQEYRFGAFLPYRREHAARRIWAAILALEPGRFDVVHYHGHVTALGSVVPAGVPFVQTLHDQGSECLAMTRFKNGAICSDTDPGACAACATRQPNAAQRWLSTLAVKRHRAKSAQAFSRHATIFVSDFLRQRFVANAAPTSPLYAQVIHNFTDTHRLALQEKSAAQRPSGDTRPVALLVGRVDAAKGFGAFLDALPDEALRHWQVRVVGDGPARRALESQHAPRGVEFLGALSQEQTYAEIAAATVSVVPSACEESCATTVLEALAMGKPTLALAQGGTPELARYQRYVGQLMLEATMTALARRLQSPLTVPPRTAWRAMGADVHDRLPEIIALYESVSSRSATPHGRFPERT
jgi:glycosyltransferase involved in cell wall biosynthesis